MLDREGRILDLNPAAEQLTGVSAPQAIGTAGETLFRASPWLAEMIRETLAEGAARRRGEGALASRRRDVPVSARASHHLGPTRGAQHEDGEHYQHRHQEDRHGRAATDVAGSSVRNVSACTAR